MNADPLPSSRIPGLAPPFDWPCRDDGLFMAHLGRVLIIRIEPQIAARTFERQLTELARAIDLRPRDQKIALLYDVPWTVSMDAVRRRAVASLLDERRDHVQATTAAFALVTASKLVRGALEAIFWLAPPTFPVTTVETTVEAFQVLQRVLPEVDPRGYEAEYRRQLGRSWSGQRPIAR